MRPNLMLITVDQMRRDCMSAANHPVVETPHLDEMCHMGHRFTHAYSSVPTCIPARAALLTGLSQRRHGRVGYEDGVDWSYPHTIASELTRAGYQTQCIGKMHVFPARNRCGFENVLLHDGYLHHSRKRGQASQAHYEGVDDYLYWLKEQCGIRSDLPDSGLGCNAWVARPWQHEEAFHPTNWCAAQTIDFFRRRDPCMPFFLHTSFVRPHSPLDPPAFYFDLYQNKAFPAPPVGDWADTQDAAHNGLLTDCSHGIIPQEALHRGRAAYYGSITHIDHQIGRILQVMGEYGLLENTIILFTSDHGDLLGDHNLFRKALPYEGSAGIPLVLYDPANLLQLSRGTIQDPLVELRDIMPTLLELAGAPLPPEVDGKSLLPLLRGQGDRLRDYLHGEHAFGALSNQFIVTKTDKYIWYSQSGQEQYFDLVTDPLECHNLIDAPEHRERIDRLRGHLIRELTGREEGYTDESRLIPGRPYTNVLTKERLDQEP